MKLDPQTQLTIGLCAVVLILSLLALHARAVRRAAVAAAHSTAMATVRYHHQMAAQGSPAKRHPFRVPVIIVGGIVAAGTWYYDKHPAIAASPAIARPRTSAPAPSTPTPSVPARPPASHLAVPAVHIGHTLLSGDQVVALALITVVFFGFTGYWVLRRLGGMRRLGR